MMSSVNATGLLEDAGSLHAARLHGRRQPAADNLLRDLADAAAARLV